ncbi:MAG: nucleotidyltransferase family protein [Solirubrobacterales bacterium]|nr:nucleotidyltransferase family protein [Solirubrobacterales bacterium]
MPDGLILAAGAGSRFGAVPKQLAFFRGQPLIQWAVDAQCAVEELDRVVLVLGAYADMVSSVLAPSRVEIVMCDAWAEGQAASLRTGLAALADSKRIVITLADQPLVSAAAIQRVIAARSTPARASYGDQPGHPVLLGPRQIAAARELSGDQGARGLLADAKLIPCDELGSGADVDTPEDLLRLTGDQPASPAPDTPGEQPFVMTGFRELSTEDGVPLQSAAQAINEPREYPPVVPPPVLKLRPEQGE